MRFATVLLFGLGACATQTTPAEAPSAHVHPLMRAKEPGDRVEPFSGKDVVSGKSMGLAPGRVNLVWFWATWSIDNRGMPRMVELAARYPQLNVVLVSVDDEPGDIPQFLRTYAGNHLPSIWDEGHRIAGDRFVVPCSPTFFVIDKGGIVRHVSCGLHDGTIEQELDAEVKKLL